MAAAVATASRTSSLPEVLGPEGIYFDPDDVDDIAAVLRRTLRCGRRKERPAGHAFATAGSCGVREILAR